MSHDLYLIGAILSCAAVTIITRFLPFWLFPSGKSTPKYIEYLGKVLPCAIIGMLVVYCFKNVSIINSPHGIPELLAGALVVILHRWKKNNLLSIGGGTVVYMILVQYVF